MRPDKRNPLLYLEDILLSMERVQEYIKGLDYEQFRIDQKTVDAVIRNFEIIGEASKNLPKEIQSIYPQVPWNEMYRLRNRITHEYFGVDHSIIWSIATKYLPTNYKDLREIFEIEKKNFE